MPIASTTTASNVSTAQGPLLQAKGGADEAQKEIEAARARLTTAQAKLREAEANATKAARDVERLRGLLAKDEMSQQQFDAAVAEADAQRAAADSAKSQVAEADAGIRVAESRLVQAPARASSRRRRGCHFANRSGAGHRHARARGLGGAHVAQAKAALQQAELNLQYTSVKAPVAGVVSRRTAEVGQIVQAGQPLMAVIGLEEVWVTANFKETQLTDIRPGQRATVKVDAFGGKEFTGHVDSIAAATGARFSLLPPENATGNYVKVVQRMPVKILLEPGQDPEHLLRPGMSVVPTVYLK